MKKLLISTSALVALGITAPATMAAEPIKLGIGGFMQQWVGYSTQAGGFKGQTTTSAGDDREYVKFDSKSAGEIFFSGNTKLDNGLTVTARVEIEAEQGTASSIDMSYIDITSPTLGQFQIGRNSAAHYLVRHVATTYGLGYNGSDGGNSVISWVVPPTAITYTPMTTAYGGSTKDQLLNYFTPRWEGFGLAFHFNPNYSTATSVASNNYQVPGGGTAGSGSHRKGYSASAVYDNTLDGWKIGANVGYWGVTGSTSVSDVHAWNYGLKVTYAGVTLSHSLSDNKSNKFVNSGNVNTNAGAIDGISYDIGLSYATGPWGVGYFFQRSDLEGNTTVTKNDVVDFHHLSGQYNLGPGIDLKGSLFHINYKDETTTAANSNKGWGLVAGMAITF